jgi:hypothetical protein
MKSRIYPFLRAVVSLLLIGLLFYIRRDSLSVTVQTIKDLAPALFISSCLAFLLAIVVMSVRLRIVLKAQGIILKHTEAAYLTFIGFFFNNFLPTAVGGDVIKAYYTYKRTGVKLRSFIAVFMDRFIGVFSLFILAGTSLLFGHRYVEEKALIWITLSMLAVLTFFCALFLSRRFARILNPLSGLLERLRLKRRLREVYGIVKSFRGRKREMAQALVLSIAAQTVFFSVIYMLARGMDSFVSLKMVLLFMPLVSIVSMLPSINGLGIREGAIYFLFGPYVGYKNAFCLSLLWLFMLLLAGLIGGISYFLKRGIIDTSQEVRKWQRS